MTYNPLVPGKAPDTEVMRGNPWTQPLTMRATDTAGNPVDWTASTFTVTSTQTADIAWDVDTTDPTNPVVTLTLTGTQTVGLPRYVHWYLADDVVMGDQFMTGRILVRDQQ